MSKERVLKVEMTPNEKTAKTMEWRSDNRDTDVYRLADAFKNAGLPCCVDQCFETYYVSSIRLDTDAAIDDVESVIKNQHLSQTGALQLVIAKRVI